MAPSEEWITRLTGVALYRSDSPCAWRMMMRIMALPEFHPSWSGPAREVLERSIERHGGWSTWQRLRSVTLGAQLLRGLLPTLKGNGRTFPLPPRFVVRPREVEAEFVDYPAPGSRGLFARGD